MGDLCYDQLSHVVGFKTANGDTYGEYKEQWYDRRGVTVDTKDDPHINDESLIARAIELTNLALTSMFVETPFGVIHQVVDGSTVEVPVRFEIPFAPTIAMYGAFFKRARELCPNGPFVPAEDGNDNIWVQHETGSTATINDSVIVMLDWRQILFSGVVLVTSMHALCEYVRSIATEAHVFDACLSLQMKTIAHVDMRV